MAHIQTFKEFLSALEVQALIDAQVRMKELSGIQESQYVGRYAVEISFESEEEPEILLEHKVYTTFNKTNNRYVYHPEDANIPVKAHYHIYPPKSKTEIYAVNVD